MVLKKSFIKVSEFTASDNSILQLEKRFDFFTVEHLLIFQWSNHQKLVPKGKIFSQILSQSFAFFTQARSLELTWNEEFPSQSRYYS
jgi:hypothetical protein